MQCRSCSKMFADINLHLYQKPYCMESYTNVKDGIYDPNLENLQRSQRRRAAPRAADGSNLERPQKQQRLQREQLETRRQQRKAQFDLNLDDYLAAAASSTRTATSTSASPTSDQQENEDKQEDDSYQMEIDWDRDNGVEFDLGDLEEDGGRFVAGEEDDVAAVVENEESISVIAEAQSVSHDNNLQQADGANETQSLIEYYLNGNASFGKWSIPINQQDITSFRIGKTDRSMARLYLLADSKGGSRDLVDSMLRVIREEHIHHGFDPIRNTSLINNKRTNFFGRISEKCDFIPPVRVNLPLESGNTAALYTFEFRQSLQRLLLSRTYSDLDNLFLKDKCSPFCCKPFSDPTSTMSHPLEFAWYQQAYNQYLKDVRTIGGDLSDHYLLVLDVYTDAISKALQSTEPLAFVDARLRSHARNNPKNWIVTAYLPPLDKTSSAHRKSFLGRAAAKDFMLRDYFRATSFALEEVIEMTKVPSVMKVRRGNEVHEMIVHIRIKCIAVDNKAADQICGRLASKHPSCLRMSRRCLCTFDDAASPAHTCYPFPDELVYALVQLALGPTYGLYVSKQGGSLELAGNDEIQDLLRARFGTDWVGVRNRTLTNGVTRLPSTELSENVEHWLNFVKFKEPEGVDLDPTRRTVLDTKTLVMVGRLVQSICGDVARSVFYTKIADNPFARLNTGPLTSLSFATTSDILHAMLNGIIRYILDGTIGRLTLSACTELDLYVENLLSRGINRGYHGEDLPRVSFRKGYSKLTELSGNERLGQIFVLAFVLSTEEGRKILEPLFDRKLGDEDPQHNPQESMGPSYCSRDDDDEDGNAQDEIQVSEQADNNIDFEELGANAPGGNVTKIVDRKSALDFLGIGVLNNLLESDLPDAHKERLDAVLSKHLSDKTVKSLNKRLNTPGLSGISLPHDKMLYRSPDNGVPQVYKRTREVETMPRSPKKLRIDECRKQEYALPLNPDQLLFVMEGLLCFVAFARYAPKELLQNGAIMNKCMANLELLRRYISEGIRRGEHSNGYSIQKFVEMAHMLMEVKEYGCSGDRDTENPEHMLIDIAVKPGRTAQKRGDDIFTNQSSSRFAEKCLLQNIVESTEELTLCEEEGGSSTNIQRKTSVGRGRYLFVNTHSGPPQLLRRDRTVFEIGDDVLMKLVSDHFQGQVVKVAMYKEATLAHSGTLIRADPSYGSTGAWYDCLLQKTGSGHLEPVRLLAIIGGIVDTGMTLSDPNFPRPKQLLVQPCELIPGLRSQDQMIFQRRQWCYERQNQLGGECLPKTNLIDISEIKGLCRCLDTDPSLPLSYHDQRSKETLWVRSMRIEWPFQFHRLDDYHNKKLKF